MHPGRTAPVVVLKAYCPIHWMLVRLLPQRSPNQATLMFLPMHPDQLNVDGRVLTRLPDKKSGVTQRLPASHTIGSQQRFSQWRCPGSAEKIACVHMLLLLLMQKVEMPLLLWRSNLFFKLLCSLWWQLMYMLVAVLLYDASCWLAQSTRQCLLVFND